MSASGPPIGWNLDGPSGTLPVNTSKSKKKSKEKKKRREKRKSSSSSSSNSSDSSSDERQKKGHKASKLRDKVKLKKHKKDKKSKHRESSPDFGVPINLMQNRVHAPETQESWQARQNVLRKVVDPSTGRER